MQIVDANIILRYLLKDIAELHTKEFLDNSPSELIIISDFSLHSIGVIMSNLKKFEEYSIFIDDSYQYCLSEKYGLEIVSFDQDFLKNNIKIYTPKEALNLLNN